MPEVLVIGGYGYVGRSIVLWALEKGYTVAIYTAERSRRARPWLEQVFNRFGVETIANTSLYEKPPQRFYEAAEDARYIVSTLGVKKGSQIHMYRSNALLPYLLIRSLVRRGVSEPLYIHVEAYPRPAYLSLYSESKALARRLLHRFMDDANVVVADSGLIIGRLPTHPEWIMMYRMGVSGIILDNGVATGYTPAYEIIPASKALYEGFGPGEYNLLLYTGGLAAIPLYFARISGRKPIWIRLPTNENMWRILPRHGELGFMKTFLYPEPPAKADKLYEIGYRPRYTLTHSLNRIYRDLKMMYGS